MCELRLPICHALPLCRVFLAVRLQGSFFLFWLSFFTTLLTSIAVAFTFAAICPTIDFANGAVPSYGEPLCSVPHSQEVLAHVQGTKQPEIVHTRHPLPNRTYSRLEFARIPHSLRADALGMHLPYACALGYAPG